jgi:hypothetical protein
MDVRQRITGPPALPPVTALPPLPEIPPLLELTPPTLDQPQPARRRPWGFGYSLVLHAAAFAFLLLPSSESPELHNVYTSLVAPLQKDHKLIWYQFKEKLPEVSPANPTAEKDARVRTPQKARQQIVTAPKADPGKQLVWIPAPQIKLKADLTAPNLIALQPPAVPAPPKRNAKPFQAPEQPKTPRPASPTALPTAPALAANEAQNSGVDALLNKTLARPRREFTPPTMPKAPTPSTAITLPAAPTLESARGPASADSLLTTPIARPRRDFTPPAAPPNSQPRTSPAALPAAPSLEAAHGPAGVSAAILGLNPSNAPQLPTPEGARAARIAAGPDTGSEPPQLAKGNSPLVIPDVSIQGKPGPSTPTATGPRTASSAKPGLGTAPMPAIQTGQLQANAHLSVPQWPSSRSLPAFLERRFHTRVVYETLLPAAQNGEDWVVWFAEEAPTPPDTRVLMRPPTLNHGSPLPPVPAKQDHGAGKLLVIGVLRKDGHFGSFSEETDAADRELLDMLQSWQFNPAMRDGVPVDVEAVLEIPVVYSAAKSVISSQ